MYNGLEENAANLRSVDGSYSKSRGCMATIRVSKEILEMCELINRYGEFSDNDNTRKVISFGDLFNIYSQISTKLVGLLLRARKQTIVSFEGECLFQTKDDNVPITLLKPIKEIRRMFKEKIQDVNETNEKLKRK